jgi:hypothetical protein
LIYLNHLNNTLKPSIPIQPTSQIYILSEITNYIFIVYPGNFHQQLAICGRIITSLVETVTFISLLLTQFNPFIAIGSDSLKFFNIRQDHGS